MSFRFGTAVLLAMGPVLLTGCDAADEPRAERQEDGVIAGLTVENARLVLPAVSGNPAAIYFDVTNSGDKPIAFRSGEVASAQRTEMHESVMVDGKMVMGEANPITVRPGETTAFKPGGLHLMVFGLSGDVGAGDKVEASLVAAGGTSHRFQARVQAAGDAR